MARSYEYVDATLSQTAPAAAYDANSAKAAMRLQRVWRTTFTKSLTRRYAIEMLKSGVGVTADYVKSIRYAFSNAMLHFIIIFV